MIDNYNITEEGIIKQIKKEKFNYDYDYSNNYNSQNYLKESLILNSLRLSFVISSFKKIPNSILDVGYGNGSFLDLSKRKIKNCYGFDVSDYPVPFNCKKIEDIMGIKVDVITFWDSLEHFDDIYFLKDLQCDIICISMPWCHWESDLDDEWFSQWKHRKPNEHLWHFNSKSLTKFMNSQGYEVILNDLEFEDYVRISSDIRQPNILTSSWKKN
jgi:hypothetical protein